MTQTEERLPTRLGVEPLVEAVWEVRFKPKHDSASAVLVGSLLSQFGKAGGTPERLAIADFPQSMRAADAHLRYAVTHRLTAGRFVYMSGDCVVALSCPRPYVRWQRFRQEIIAVADLIQRADVIEAVERVSLKYLNILAMDEKPSLGRLNVEASFGGVRPDNGPVEIRAELRLHGDLHIVRIALPAEARYGESLIRGTLAEVDTVVTDASQLASWSGNLGSLIDRVHTSNKRVFFSLLRSETLRELRPEYES